MTGVHRQQGHSNVIEPSISSKERLVISLTDRQSYLSSELINTVKNAKHRLRITRNETAK